MSNEVTLEQFQRFVDQLGKLTKAQIGLAEQLDALARELAVEIANRDELESTFVGFGNNAMREISQLRNSLAEAMERLDTLEAQVEDES